MAEHRTGWRSGGRRWAGALLAGTLLLSACSSAETTDGEISAQVVKNPWVAADVALTDTSGAPYSFAAEPTKPLTLVFFGYANCPDVCQLVMSNVTSALTRIGDKVDDIDMVFVTTDPVRDTPKALRSYLDRYNPAFIGVTGKLADLSAAAASFHVVFEKGKKLPSGGYDITHGTQVFALDPDHKIRHYWSPEATPQALAHDFTQLLEAAK